MDFNKSLVPALFAAGLMPNVATADVALMIKPPIGHEVIKATLEPGYTETFDVNSTLDSNAGCTVAFKPVSPSGATQAALNRLATTPAHVETVKLSLGFKLDNARVEPYRHGDVDGVRVSGNVEGGAGIATLNTILETPRGRTVVVCISPIARIDALRPELEAITRGVVPPR